MKKKVLAYIIRNHNGRDEILIHEHRDEPEAGVQVPAGTVEIGESLETALYREIFEETGLKELELLRKLDSYIFFNEYKKEYQERNVYLLQASDPTQNSWEHTVTGEGEDHDLIFLCSWRLVNQVKLSGEMDKSIHLIMEWLK